MPRQAISAGLKFGQRQAPSPPSVPWSAGAVAAARRGQGHASAGRWSDRASACSIFLDVVDLDRVSLTLGAGQTLAVLGPKGAGKSTLLRLIAGLQSPWSGTLTLDGSTDLVSLDVIARVQRGIVLCPEGRRIFTTLSVEENLRIGGTALLARTGGVARLRDGLERAYALFPILAERRHGPGSALSGGQQQMLAIARALMGAPRLLLLDEPSPGLSPVMADEVYATLDALKADGMTLIVVEEAAGRPLHLADTAMILRKGKTVWSGSAADARNPDLLLRAYLGEHAA